MSTKRKTLVAYFSASGVTKKVAQKLAGYANADLFCIKPLVPYTDADLNWRDKNSRSTLEMKDRDCRPPMAEKIDISGYNTVFVGFPVWWYREPSIIDTFMESADFSGKTVVVFCTSGGSDPGDSSKNIAALVPKANVKEGVRISGRAADREIEQIIKPYM